MHVTHLEQLCLATIQVYYDNDLRSQKLEQIG